MTHYKRIFAVAFLTCLGHAAVAENWAQWRGPTFNGATSEKYLPTTWSKEEGVVWKTPLPGPSGSTPVIWNDSVFVSSPDAQKNLLLLCLDRKDGNIRWQKEIAVGDRSEGRNNMTAPSPVTDGKAVYALYGTSDLAALDFSGKILWQRNLGKDYGKFSIMWLYGSSPLLYKGKLYVQVLQRSPSSYPHSTDGKTERESYLLCIDPKTGKDLWRHIRPAPDSFDESQESYATPTPYHGKNGDELILIGGDCVTGHNPETGAELWRCYGLNPGKDHWRRVVPSAVASDGLIFACGPKREPVLAIRDGGKGLVTETHVAWKFAEHSPDVCTPLVYQGKLFILDGDNKVMTCLDPKTGEKKWEGKIPAKDVMRASATGADGKIYCLDEAGNVFVLDAGSEFKLLSTIPMGEGPCRSVIAVANGQLFIRTAENLYCIGTKK